MKRAYTRFTIAKHIRTSYKGKRQAREELSIIVNYRFIREFVIPHKTFKEEKYDVRIADR